jgi:hypothetical protein
MPIAPAVPIARCTEAPALIIAAADAICTAKQTARHTRRSEARRQDIEALMQATGTSSALRHAEDKRNGCSSKNSQTRAYHAMRGPDS